MISTGK